MGLARGMPGIPMIGLKITMTMICWRSFQREIAFSQYLKAECARLDCRYFDVSQQFLPVWMRPRSYLTARLLNG